MNRKLLTILLLVLTSSSNADTGIRLLSVACNSSALTIEPFIAWNEETAKYSDALQNGKSKDGDTTIYYFSKRYTESVRTNCSVGGHAFEITVIQGELEITENKKVLLHKAIENVWDIYGPVYKLRYSQNSWREYCGHVERNPSWRSAKLEEKNTNCQ